MYSKFVLPNWTVFSHILKWVRQWSVTGDHYSDLYVISLPSEFQVRNVKYLFGQSVNNHLYSVAYKNIRIQQLLKDLCTPHVINIMMVTSFCKLELPWLRHDLC